MPRWHQGYVSDVEYTHGFTRETTPAWLHFVALLLGYRAPDPGGPLRIADLGCGNAITAAVIAATSPEAEIWGFDFNPLHVDAGRRLASAAGLRPTCTSRSATSPNWPRPRRAPGPLSTS